MYCDFNCSIDTVLIIIWFKFQQLRIRVEQMMRRLDVFQKGMSIGRNDG